VLELILSKLPQENLKNNFAVKLQEIIKARKKKSRKDPQAQNNDGPSATIK
jgi:hypothetical protein